jgi:uncharacterized protein (DUF1684 family)
MKFTFFIQQLGRQRLSNRKWLFLCFLFACLYILTTEPGFLFSYGEENPLEQRKQKLKVFREKRDKFFKEDSHSPLKEADRKTFKALHYYPIDLNYAMVGPIERYPVEPKPLYVNLRTSKGNERKYVKYGRFKFKWMGKEYALQIYRPLGGGELFLPFKDKTSETETPSNGRYLSVESMPGGKVLIDFNRAYNPFCEFNEKYTCPFAPEENQLDIPIRAGEKRFR